MDSIQYIRKTDLARNTRRVIRDVQRGQMAVVESHGQPEVAIIDIIDYRIQRAFIHYHTQDLDVSENDTVSDEAFENIADEQALFDRVLAYFFADVISLARVAELLKLPQFDLRLRFSRLGIPFYSGPQSKEEATQDIDNALTFSNQNRS